MWERSQCNSFLLILFFIALQRLSIANEAARSERGARGVRAAERDALLDAATLVVVNLLLFSSCNNAVGNSNSV